MLKERRIAAGLSQRELSEMSGIPLRTIEHYERYGIEGASLRNAAPIANVLGIWIDQLLTDEYDGGIADEGDN